LGELTLYSCAKQVAKTKECCEIAVKNKAVVLVLVVFLLLAISACGSGEENTGTIPSGEELFSKPILGSQPGCKTCHSLEEGVVIVGPSMAGVAMRAAGREPGKSAEEYLGESINDPNAFIVTSFPADTMPKNYAKELTPEEINSLVAYLMTLK